VVGEAKRGKSTLVNAMLGREVLLLEAPHRVGKPLRDTLSGFHSARLSSQWRALYRIDESKHAVIMQDIQHRSTAYRRR
jgi:mRNA interferase RelE/StbE